MLNLTFDMDEAQRSNVLISGANHSGKSRLACGIASALKVFDWQVIAFDNAGAYEYISDLPSIYRLEPSGKDYRYP